MRIFSIAQWHHFAYMIISVAMLGFGAIGTLLALARGWVRGREKGLLVCAAFLLGLSLPTAYALSQRVPFETFQLTIAPTQWVWLFFWLMVAGLLWPLFSEGNNAPAPFLLTGGLFGWIGALIYRWLNT